MTALFTPTTTLTVTVDHNVWAQIGLIQDGDLVLINLTAHNGEESITTADGLITINLHPDPGDLSGIESLEGFLMAGGRVTSPLRWAILSSISEVLMHLAKWSGEKSWHHFTLKHQGIMNKQAVLV